MNRRSSTKPQEPLRPASALAGGLLSVLVQGAVLRSALAGHHMAELATGLVLACWLAGSGLGAAVAGRCGHPRAVWNTGMLALPFLGLLSLSGLQSAIPFPLSVLPAGLVAGAVFVAPFSSSRFSTVYFLEAIGACTGGALFLLLSPAMLAFPMAAVSLVTASFALFTTGARKTGALGILVSAAILVSGIPGRMEKSLLVSSMTGFSEAEAFPSPYGEVVLARRQDQYSVFRNGILETSWPARESAEVRMTAPLLLVHPPRRILYIGSSPEETSLLENWPGVERLDVVVPDRALLEAVPNFPANAYSGDGRSFLAESNARWDLVVVSTGSPLSLLSNRFYTEEFFGLTAGSVEQGGAVVVFLEGGVNRLSSAEAELAGSVLRAGSVSSEWQAVLPAGGVTLVFGLGERPVLDAASLAERLDSLDVPMVFMTPGTLRFDLSDLRWEQLNRQVGSSTAEPNRDLNPVAFRLASEIWDSRTGEGSRWEFLLYAALAVSLLLVVLSGVLSGRPAVSASLASTGLSGLAVEVMAILGVQATLGYSWTVVGIIAGAFHAGGAIGSRIAPGLKGCIEARMQVVSACAAAVCAGAGLLYSAGILTPGMFAAVLMVMLLPAGVAGGAAFVGAARKCASRACMTQRGNQKTAGAISLASYAGSMAGAVVVPLILFPMIGAVTGMMAVAIVSVLSAPFVRGKSAVS